MRLNEDFGRFLALAVAIRRRDEVAVAQFAAKIATELVEESEIQAAAKPGNVRNAEGIRRQEEKLRQEMIDYMSQLSSLVDQAGMDWLREQTSS